ncbi:MAG: tetratricopeptide repeat protein [Planctomycetaceae bacterium]|nr:tetratricopeptide repeat protein [Planctomycetaceae bacterium]
MRFVFRFILLVTVTSLVLSSSANAQQQPLSAKTMLDPVVEEYGPKYQDVETAIDRLRRGQVGEARELLRTASKNNPELPPADIMLAQALFGLNQLAAGRTALEEAARNNPTDPAAYVYLGELAFQNRRWTEANLLYKKALELTNAYSANPKRKKRLLVNIHGGFGSMAELRENWPEAKQQLQALLALDKTNALAMTRLGRVMFKMAKNRDDENKAYKVFQTLHKSKPDETATADVNMGLLYEQSGNRNNAEAMMKRAAKNDANNVKTRLAVAKWALDANNLPMAKANAEAAAKIDPDSLDAKLYIGLIARFENDLPTAEKAFKQAHLQSPNNLGAMTQLSLVMVDQADEKKRAEALEFARLNSRIHQDLSKAAGREAAVTYGWVLSRLGQNANAVRTVQQAMSAGSVSADSAYHAAQILYDSGQNDAANAILQKTLAGDAMFPNRKAAEQLLAKLQN